VKWRGYNKNLAAWIAARDMVNAKELVEHLDNTKAKKSQ
jgi:hypothetical protein